MDRSKKPLPTHAKCPKCGDEVKLDAWIYAHWDIELKKTCEKCGSTLGLKRGYVYVIQS